MYSERKHEYIVSSERAYRRDDEYRVSIYTDAVYKVGDEMKVDGLIWTVEEVVK